MGEKFKFILSISHSKLFFPPPLPPFLFFGVPMVGIQGILPTSFLPQSYTPIPKFLTVNPNKIWESKEMIDLVNPHIDVLLMAADIPKINQYLLHMEKVSVGE